LRIRVRIWTVLLGDTLLESKSIVVHNQTNTRLTEEHNSNDKLKTKERFEKLNVLYEVRNDCVNKTKDNIYMI